MITLLASTLALAAQDSPPAPALERFQAEVYDLAMPLLEEHRVPGLALAVLVGGELAWAQGLGFADVAEGREVQPETVFNIGSISKTVAAWGLMRLVEEGKVDLDAPVEGYLKRWKLPESEFDPKKVTLRRLLSHTAGLSLHGYPGFEPGAELPTVEASLSGATNGSGDVHLVSEPGTEWRYSGGGFTLAQLLCEEVTGEGFREYMHATVLEPLGMLASDYGWNERVTALAATPYDEEGEPIGGPRFTALAAAGLQTSALELARFAKASLPKHRAKLGLDEVLRTATVELMQQPVAPSDSYGLGYAIEDELGLRVVGHGGANEGWMADLAIAPESGDAIVLLTNGTNGRRVHQPVRRLWVDWVRKRRGTR